MKRTEIHAKALKRCLQAYNLRETGKLTFKEIGDVFHVSSQRARQLFGKGKAIILRCEHLAENPIPGRIKKS
jgi:hypothetical protein